MKYGVVPHTECVIVYQHGCQSFKPAFANGVPNN